MNIRAKIYGGFQPIEESLLKAKKPKGAKADTLDSVRVPRETRRQSNNRGDDRHRLADERVKVTYKRKSFETDLINLSGGGAMIAAPFEPKLWELLNLHLGDHGTIECAVRWIRDGRIGLEFAHETRLDWPSDQVAMTLRNVIERSFPDITFPESAADPEPVKPQVHDDEHRSAARHPLIWNGTLHHDYQSDPVRIRNISKTGAMIEVAAMVRVGAEPLLELSDAVSISATVEWVVGDQVGLRFHSPFRMDLLAEARPALATSDWRPPSYLEDEADGDDRWDRLSLPQLKQELEGFLKR